MLFQSYSLSMIEQISIYVNKLENKDLLNNLVLENQ